MFKQPTDLASLFIQDWHGTLSIILNIIMALQQGHILHTQLQLVKLLLLKYPEEPFSSVQTAFLIIITPCLYGSSMPYITHWRPDTCIALLCTKMGVLYLAVTSNMNLEMGFFLATKVCGQRAVTD